MAFLTVSFSAMPTISTVGFARTVLVRFLAVASVVQSVPGKLHVLECHIRCKISYATLAPTTYQSTVLSRQIRLRVAQITN